MIEVGDKVAVNKGANFIYTVSHIKNEVVWFEETNDSCFISECTPIPHTIGTDDIVNLINEVLKDERFHYKTADVFSNAPLALLQYGMETKLHALQRVLGIPLTSTRKLKNE